MQIAGGKPLKCSWGRHQARQSPMNISMISMMNANQAMVPRQNPLLLQQLAVSLQPSPFTTAA